MNDEYLNSRYLSAKQRIEIVWRNKKFITANKNRLLASYLPTAVFLFFLCFCFFVVRPIRLKSK